MPVTFMLRWPGPAMHAFVALVDRPPTQITDDCVSDLMASAPTDNVPERRAVRVRPIGRRSLSPRPVGVWLSPYHHLRTR